MTQPTLSLSGVNPDPDRPDAQDKAAEAGSKAMAATVDDEITGKKPRGRPPKAEERMTATEVMARRFAPAPLSLHERIQAIRQEISYILKTPTPGAPYPSAVAHGLVLEKCRPYFVKAGILWFPVEAEVMGSSWHGMVPTQKGERFMHYAQIRTVIRFVRADCPGDFIDIPVITDGWDDQDKAGPKASTYADKLAVMRILNLQSGDDPDFDRVGIESGIDQGILDQIKRLRALVDEHPDHKGDPEAYIRGALILHAKRLSRYRVPPIEGLGEKQLADWISSLEKEKAERAKADSP